MGTQYAQSYTLNTHGTRPDWVIQDDELTLDPKLLFFLSFLRLRLALSLLWALLLS